MEAGGVGMERVKTLEELGEPDGEVQDDELD